MGGGSWSRTAYDDGARKSLADHGDRMAYTSVMSSVPRSDWKPHEALDPKSVNKAGAHTNQNIREALDSDEHPESLPIVVIFDVTGSMGRIPRVLQEKLPALHGMLMRKGYVDHPQILFGAVGDAHGDRAPLQMSQFESDNRMDEHLSNLLLEGAGGGGNHESYDLAIYFAARKTYLDSLQKRGKKGYLFIIGDERAYSKVERSLVAEYVGDSLQEDIPTAEIVAEAQEKFEVFYLFAAQGNYEPPQVIDPEDDGFAVGWRELLGQNALVLEDANAVCETIALQIAVMEGRISIEEGAADLVAAGADRSAAEAAGRAVVMAGEASSGGGVATTSGEFDEPEAAESGAETV